MKKRLLAVMLAGLMAIPGGVYHTTYVLWTVQRNIIAGTTLTTFVVNDTCSRAQISFIDTGTIMENKVFYRLGGDFCFRCINVVV